MVKLISGKAKSLTNNGIQEIQNSTITNCGRSFFRSPKGDYNSETNAYVRLDNETSVKEKQKFEVVEFFYNFKNECYMLVKFNKIGMIRFHKPGFPVSVYRKPTRFEKAWDLFETIKEREGM